MDSAPHVRAPMLKGWPKGKTAFWQNEPEDSFWRNEPEISNSFNGRWPTKRRSAVVGRRFQAFAEFASL